MQSEQYRVVWKREGMHQKTRPYQTLTGAKNFYTLLGPEPWRAFNRSPEDHVCCSGYQCNCQGLTFRKDSDRRRVDLPSIEFVHIETRSVGPWAIKNLEDGN